MRRISVVLAFAGLLVTLQVAPAMAAARVDVDADWVDDSVDNCLEVFNPYQHDADGDGVGDLCDADDADVTVGTDGDDSIDGTSRNDALYGAGGDDVLDGGPGNDFLSGGPGEDRLTGGPGCDRFAFDPYASQTVTITDFSPGIDRFAFPPFDDDPGDDPYPDATFAGGETLVVTFFLPDSDEVGIEVSFEGIPAGTVIFFDTSPCGSGQAEVPDPGDDPVDPEPGDDDPVDPGPGGGDPPDPVVPDPCDGGSTLDADANPFVGTLLSDTITVSPGFTATIIGDFDDALVEGCHDIITADDGEDFLIGDNRGGDLGTGGNDTIEGGDNNDFIVGDSASSSAFTVTTGGDDVLDGGAGHDTLVGDAGRPEGTVATVVDGGDDVLDGGPGEDTLYGDTDAGDVTNGGDDTLSGGEDDDTLFGDSGSGTVINGGDDVLDGGPGNDTLYGDVGLFGSLVLGGDDTLTGGTGNDTFVFDTASDFGSDTITDAGAGGDEDVVRFLNVPGTGLVTDLDAVATIVDNGPGNSVVVTMNDDGASITIEGIGTAGNTIDTATELDATAEVLLFVTAP